MKHIAIGFLTIVGMLGGTARAASPQTANAAEVPVAGTATGTSVPRLVQFSGTLKDGVTGSVLTGVQSATFAIYSQQDGGTALWSETQNVTADASGHYSVVLGAASANGVPADLFASGETRWLAVTTAKAEMARVLMVSVPYAMKAGDSDTLGGLPASAYLTTASLATNAAKGTTVTAVVTTPGATSAVATPQAASAPALTEASPTGSGTADYIPLWTSSSALGNSILFQSPGGNIGVGTTTPALKLDVNGDSIFRGSFQLPPQGTATATTGQPSHSFQWEASIYNSSSKAAITDAFGFRAVPANNNTASPYATLDLFYGPGGGTLTDTGLSINPSGFIEFVSEQTFPGVAELGADNVFTTSQTVDGFLSAQSPTLGLYGIATNTSGSSVGVEGISSATTGYGVLGQSAFVGVYGESSGASTLGLGRGKAGVWGDSGGTSGGGYKGVLGTADDNSAGVFLNNGTYSALLAENQSTGRAIEGEGVGGGTGVFGGNGTLSTQAGSIGTSPGVWGDISGTTAFAGVVGTADNNDAGWFSNHSADAATLEIENASTATGPLLFAYANASGNYCEIDTTGNLGCTGTVTAIATVDGARKVTQYSVQSPENWSEDFGSATLANGTATVSLEATFAQTVNTAAGYHVYVTPNGDCKGLYVANKTASGFEVREIGGGTSSVAFDYRIVAKRVGYENVRLQDVTARQAQIESRSKKLRSGAAKPAGTTKSAPRLGAGSPVAAAPAISVTARQLAAATSVRTAKPTN